MSDVALVSMPFGNIFAPSMGLSLLKGGLERLGVSNRVLYFGIPFAERVGQALYSDIASAVRPSIRELAGEWIFAGALFDEPPSAERRYIEEILQGRKGWITHHGACRTTPARIARLQRARGLVDEFLDWCLAEVLAEQPAVVGLTSVYQQHVASLAFARRLKAAAPEITVVLGGANCEGVMGAETARQFAFVDAVVSGEANLVFPDLVRRVLAGRSVEGLAGVLTPGRMQAGFDAEHVDHADATQDMDSLPYPDYRDFFEQFQASRCSRDWHPRIFFESSRGCWWGAKQHCTFCGLNGLTMSFRSKSAGRVVDEITHLTRQYPDCDIQVTDNILDMRYFRDVLPTLAKRKQRFDLFYETKSNLQKDQVKLLRAAGVGQIQPGIESFSDSILTLMRKGVSGIQNVQLLKWCKEFDVYPHWNVLWGFPGEHPEEYEQLARLAPKLTHLVPPVASGGIRLDRFSPHFFDAARLGLTDVQPLPAYRHVYRLPPDAVANLAYHFTFRYADARDPSTYVDGALREIDTWRRVHAESDLFMTDDGNNVVIWDLRPIATDPVVVLRGTTRRLYAACDGIATVARLSEEIGATHDDVECRMAHLVARNLVMRSGERYLGLAVPLGAYQPTPSILKHVTLVARRLGRPWRSSLAISLRSTEEAPEVLAAVPPARTPRRGRAPLRRSLRSLRPDQLTVRKERELFLRFPST